MSEQNKNQEEIVTVQQNKTDLPKRYKVLLHNDDYTTMDFVIMILKRVFQHSHLEAERIMLNIHEKGVGVAGVYTFEVGETKVIKVNRMATDHGHPLKCSMEPE